MDQNLWFSQVPCFGKDPEYGLVPQKKQRKKTIKRGQTSLFLSLIGFALFCLNEGHVTPAHDNSFYYWLVGFVGSSLLALYVFFYKKQQRRRRRRYGTYD